MFRKIPLSPSISRRIMMIHQRKLAAECRKEYSNSAVVLLQEKDGTIKEQVQHMRDIMKGDDDKNVDPSSFSSSQQSSAMNKWDTLWKNGTTPWDLGKATPVLKAELERQRKSTSFLPITWGAEKFKKCADEYPPIAALVPGCGSGYDLETIARYLQTLEGERYLNGRFCREPPAKVVGLDISETSLNQAHQRLSSLLEGNGRDTDQLDAKFNPKRGSAKIQLKLGDFFSPTTDWVTQFQLDYNIDDGDECRNICEEGEKDLKFDFIYDYTFFCALDPFLRKKWGERISTLLKPKSGKLLTLVFPFLEGVDTSGPLRGPPYPVTVDDYKRVLEPVGFRLTEGPYTSDFTVESRRKQEFVCWWSLNADFQSFL